MADQEQERDTGAVADFIERIAAELTEMGMPRMASRIFACLLADDVGALTSAELGERLHVSPAAVSGAVRYLAQVGLVAREREPGSRRERYHVYSDRWYETFTHRDYLLRRLENTLKSGLDVLGPGTSAGRRIAETADFFAFLHEEMGKMEQRWREHVRTHHRAPPEG